MWGGGSVTDVTVYLKLYARPVSMKLEEMYLFFFYDHRKFMPPSALGVWAVMGLGHQFPPDGLMVCCN